MSDIALVGSDFKDTEEGLNYLKGLQCDGRRLILLSSRPEFCMHTIDAYTLQKEKIIYKNLDILTEKGQGIDINLYDQSKLLKRINIQADYTILGNGIKIFNDKEETIYEAPYLEEEVLEHMITSFMEYGYTSYPSHLQKDSIQKIYQFLTSQMISNRSEHNIYGVKCCSRSSYENDLLIEHIEYNNPSIVGYLLNGYLCFYQKNVNKLMAFEHLLSICPDIDLNQTSFILCDATDYIIAQKYPDLSYCFHDSIDGDYSLVKTLKKVDHIINE